MVDVNPEFWDEKNQPKTERGNHVGHLPRLNELEAQAKENHAAAVEGREPLEAYEVTPVNSYDDGIRFRERSTPPISKMVAAAKKESHTK